jgi:hypothetical protein
MHQGKEKREKIKGNAKKILLSLSLPFVLASAPGSP